MDLLVGAETRTQESGNVEWPNALRLDKEGQGKGCGKKCCVIGGACTCTRKEKCREGPLRSSGFKSKPLVSAHALETLLNN